MCQWVDNINVCKRMCVRACMYACVCVCVCEWMKDLISRRIQLILSCGYFKCVAEGFIHSSDCHVY